MLNKIASALGYEKKREKSTYEQVKETDEAFTKANECQDCLEIRTFKAKRLDDLEEAMKSAPEQMGGSTLIQENGKVKLESFTSKTAALKLLERARKGEIRLVF